MALEAMRGCGKNALALLDLLDTSITRRKLLTKSADISDDSLQKDEIRKFLSLSTETVHVTCGTDELNPIPCEAVLAGFTTQLVNLD